MLKEECKAASAQLEEQGFDIPWTMIQQLVEWIQDNCFNRKQSFRGAASEPTGWQMYSLYRRSVKILRKEGFKGKGLRKAANALTDTVLSSAASFTGDQLDDIYVECNS